MNETRAQVGIFGGTGFYSLLSGDLRTITVTTPFETTSDVITLGMVGTKTVAFMPRHGSEHTIPPHRINYRANLWAMHALGVTDIIAPSACGSLQPHIHPGDFVICDQFVDRTRGRSDTFYDGPDVVHVSAADPYCPILRHHAIAVCRSQEIPFHAQGTMVVIQGPRFSTRAESRWFTAMGWDVVGMTQYPECYLARELEISYATIGVVTDYDAGLVSELPEVQPVTNEEAVAVFRTLTERLRGVVLQMIETLPDTSESPARSALSTARFD